MSSCFAGLGGDTVGGFVANLRDFMGRDGTKQETALLRETGLDKTGGRQGIRTPDPRVANAMLSQLS
jgi:hypothetical protein